MMTKKWISCLVKLQYHRDFVTGMILSQLNREWHKFNLKHNLEPDKER
jgi:hypothetical protein